ncbi:MAG TPA: hypothetical protein VK171_11985 [Fimbriimonas sp.]|nr:hypothetical protein [Fimbriimonas sp.]
MRFISTLAILAVALVGCSTTPAEVKNAPVTTNEAPVETPKEAAPDYAGEWRLAITADGTEATGSLTILPDGSFEQLITGKGKKIDIGGKINAEEVSIPGKTVTALDFVISIVDGVDMPASKPFRMTYEKEFDTLTDTSLAVWVRPDKLEATKAARK